MPTRSGRSSHHHRPTRSAGSSCPSRGPPGSAPAIRFRPGVVCPNSASAPYPTARMAVSAGTVTRTPPAAPATPPAVVRLASVIRTNSIAFSRPCSSPMKRTGAVSHSNSRSSSVRAFDLAAGHSPPCGGSTRHVERVAERMLQTQRSAHAVHRRIAAADDVHVLPTRKALHCQLRRLQLDGHVGADQVLGRVVHAVESAPPSVRATLRWHRPDEDRVKRLDQLLKRDV